MAVVIVILLNVLIAQLSYTYSEAKKVAKLQYAAEFRRGQDDFFQTANQPISVRHLSLPHNKLCYYMEETGAR